MVLYEARGPIRSFSYDKETSEIVLGDDFMESLPESIRSRVTEDNRSDKYCDHITTLATKITDPKDQAKAISLMPD